ncbi:MAG: apolipoprotein N-acyltransferase [Betaproteobacteria bacterium]|nr:apolipoprotein N-acyltransferase [Betaproteobacteria bacterium]
MLLLISLLLGAAGVAAFAPLGWFPVAWLTMAGLAMLVFGAPSPRDSARRAYIFGLGHFLTGVSWVYVSLHDVGGMPLPIAAFATVALCAYLALFPALAAWGARQLAGPQAAPLRQALVFAAAWTFAEWGRGCFLTGFPWLALGYSQSPPSPLAGFAPLLGVYGLSFLTVFLAGLIAAVVSFWRGRGASLQRLISAFLVLALLGSGALLRQVPWTSPVGEPVRVALLQGNIPQELKWRPERFIDSLDAYVRLAAANPAQLTVLPETAIPALYDQVPVEFLEDLRHLAGRRHGDVLMGVAVGDNATYRNSAVTFGASSPQSYSKRHLVPFGEYVPPGFAWFLALMQMPMSDFTAGPAIQAPLAIAGQQVAPNICYEDVFGEELIRALPAATLLINLSNTAWFGHSLAQPQHLQISQLRALETGRPMLRATNTGMTAVVDPDGTVRDALPPFTRGALVADVQGYQGLTPYVRIGNAGILILIGLALVIGALLRRRESK